MLRRRNSLEIMRRPTFTAAAALIAVGLLPRAIAQAPASNAIRGATPPPSAATASGAATVERATEMTYDRDRSRALFAACDADSDDRLDLFEAQSALQDVGEPGNLNWFRRLDTDRDGYVDWPEFDAFYRNVVRDGNTLHLRLLRALPAVATPAGGGLGQAPRRTIDLFDANHDGALDIAEGEAMLKELGVPPNLIRMAPTLDTDRDGRYSQSELAPAMQLLHIDLFAPVAPKSGGPAATVLPAPWQEVDGDNNQSIDRKELALALRRIDPQLDRWTAKIMAATDRNGDGRLSPGELPAPEQVGAQAMAERVGRR